MRLKTVCLKSALFAAALILAAQTIVFAQSIYEMPQAVESRVASGENPTTVQKDYEILPRVSGKGRYLGANIGVIINTKEYFNTWRCEGEVKIYTNGDTELPTIAGTGTEDYIGTAWGQGRFSNLYAGSPVADEKKYALGFLSLSRARRHLFSNRHSRNDAANRLSRCAQPRRHR